MAIISLRFGQLSSTRPVDGDVRSVIVTDGDERSALAVVRSLGRRNIAVHVGAERATSLAGSSKYCRCSFVYPSPIASPQGFVDAVMEHARSHGVSFIFPVTDLAVELLGVQPNSDVIPSMDQYHALSDKYRLMRWAEAAGIPIPSTLYIPDGKIEQALSAINHWPVVVKPGRSLYERKGVWIKTGVRYVHNPDDLRRLYAEAEELQFPSLIQSRIIGQGEGIFGLFDRGKPRALFAHRRLREKPPSGGVSVLRESIAVSEPMAGYARQLAESVAWHGVMMIEFKVDPRSRVPFLMEVNGRFWGSLQLAIDAGVDFPWLLYQLADGGEVSESRPYAMGVQSRWWLGDLDHLLLCLRNTNNVLNLPQGCPSKWVAVGDFLRVGDHMVKNEVIRSSDLGPGLHELAQYGGRVLRRIGQGIGSLVCKGWRLMTRAVWKVSTMVGLQRLLLKTRLPSRIDRVLVLCKGNICRSPFAAHLLNHESYALHVPLDVYSAGLDTTPGKEAYPLAKEVCHQYGVDLDQHRTVSVTTELIERADVVLVMETVHSRALFRRFPRARGKTFLLGEFSVTPVMEIEDPYGGTQEEFIRCYALIDKACKGFLRYVNRATEGTGGFAVAE